MSEPLDPGTKAILVGHKRLVREVSALIRLLVGEKEPTSACVIEGCDEARPVGRAFCPKHAAEAEAIDWSDDPDD